MEHRPTQVYNKSWTNHHHVAANSRKDAEMPPINVNIVNKIPATKESEDKSDDPIKDLKLAATRQVLGSTDMWGGLLILGLAGLGLLLWKSPGESKK